MKFAVVHNWPGQKNSELELIIRISRIAGELGHECTVMDPFGHPLKPDGTHIENSELVDLRAYDFCLNLHYVNPNIFDTFSYVVNWNPFNYVMRSPIDGSELPPRDIRYRAACLGSHDALLSAGSEEMNDFAASLDVFGQRLIAHNNLYLHTTSESVENVELPDFNDFRVFYIGANWERQEGCDRHGVLMQKLDDSGVVDFYGVRKQHGISLWENVRHYKGELPFDGGKSIIETSNQCGVSLVLHSEAHRQSGLVSTRIFQACASKSLTICDDNSFILKHFGDSVLSFKYSIDPAENFRKIMELIDWIRENPDAAREKALAAHGVFVEKFSLQKEVANLLDSHKANIEQHAREFHARDSGTGVDVLYAYYDGQVADLERFFKDIRAQESVIPKPVVFTDPGSSEPVLHMAEAHDLACDVIECEVTTGRKSLVFDGGLVTMYLKAHIRSDYFAFYSKPCQWKSGHLSRLVRALENNDATISHSGIFVKNRKYTYRKDEYYDDLMRSIHVEPSPISEHDIAVFNAGQFPGSSLLFRTDAFQADQGLLRSLRFFDKGWALYLVSYWYLQVHELPVFVPKLSVMYWRDDNSWDIDIYDNADQSESFERSLTHVFFKNNPYYGALGRFSGTPGSSNLDGPSLNENMHNILRNRPWLLKTYRGLFKLCCKLLNIKYVEVLEEKNKQH